MNAAAISSAVINTASGVLYTVSGALSIGSVAITAATALPLLAAGITSLGLNAAAFGNTLAGSYTPDVLAGRLSDALSSVNDFRSRVRSGGRLCVKLQFI